MTKSSLGYVRTQMLDQADPPLNQTGAIKWVRENLFSSALNIVLTVLSIVVVVYIFVHLAPWFWHTVWNAGSLSECRAIRDATWGSDASSACFAVIRERWPQLMFGFYPSDSYWRPVLSLVLMLAALMPILFTSLPRRLLLFTAAVPFLLFWLIWGGSIWFPMTLAICLVAIFAAGIAVAGRGGLLWGMIAGLIVFAFLFLDPLSILLSLASSIASLFTAEPVMLGGSVFGTDLRDIFPLYGHLVDALRRGVDLTLPHVKSKDIGGFMLAVVIGVTAISLSLPLGILLALGRKSDMWIVHFLSTAFIEIIRGVPLIVWLFTASLLLNYFLPPGTNFDLMLRVIIMVTLFSAAYIAEVVRGGLAALPSGQYEAADALGLDYWKAMRLIILPQALKISIPGIVNTFIGLFKDTTLVMFIGLYDPLGLISAIRATTDWNGIYWELYVFIAVVFFIFCFSMGRYSLYLERKLQREHR